ncbi:MAG: GH39 family glycosyl hydrolase [Acidobacteriaceae bacterium]
MGGRRWFPVLAILAGCVSIATAQSKTTVLNLSFGHDLGPLDINHIALGQGGMSPDPMWHSRVPEVRALHPALIRLFVQQYFDLMPKKGQYHFEALDRSVDDIVAAGAIPVMNLTLKPKLLYPTLNERIVNPTSYPAWEDFISHVVNHYKKRGLTGLYWEVGNEPDNGEAGGSPPYLFTAANYLNYYRHTIEAVLRADPTAHVGGPALAHWNSPILPALLSFCANRHVRLDFVSWHIYSSDPSAIEKTVYEVKALLSRYPSLHPETILDEWNMGKLPNDPRIQAAFIDETAWRMKEAGLTYSCYYQIRDYRIDRDDFTPFLSPADASAAAFWWNRWPEFFGLFDFQNVMRPSYFSFLLLSRLTGDRLEADSSNPNVHAFLTYDKSYGMYSLLFWNFSADPVDISIETNGQPAPLYSFRCMLDAQASSNLENVRLRHLDTLTLTSGREAVPVHLGPYGIQFWTLTTHVP